MSKGSMTQSQELNLDLKIRGTVAHDSNPIIHMGKCEAEKNLKKLMTCEAWNKRSCLKQCGRRILKPEVAI